MIRVALVTGAARRVGRAIALGLAGCGHDVAVHYRGSHDEATATGREIESLGRRAVLIRGNLLESTTWGRIVEETIERLGRLDVLVNNASAFLTEEPDTIESFDDTLWERMLRVNLIAPAGLAHHAAPHLSERGDGLIVNLCDAALARPWRRHLAYQASKAGLACLTQTLAKALAPNVRVNGVSPGLAVFPESYTAEQRERLVGRVPLGRAGRPEDVASMVCHLATAGGYITGEIIRVDGGRGLT
jgi:pteridine reductase